MGSKEVHVLMVTMAAQGHMNPMVRLAQRLASKGVYVTIATNELARHLLLKSNMSTTFITTENNNHEAPKINLEFFSDGLSLEFDRGNNIETYMEFLQREGSKSFSNLITNLTSNGKKVSCIISNPFLSWVTDIAADLDIPAAVLWIQASAVFSIYYQYFMYPNMFSTLENMNKFIELPELPVLQVKDLPSFILPINPYESLRKAFSDFVQSLSKTKWVLANTFNELEEKMIKSLTKIHPIYPIGPLVSPYLLGTKETAASGVDLWGAEDSCIEWLHMQPASSVIYISFGSIMMLTQEMVDNLAMGLMNSNKPFLWVNKPPEKASKGMKYAVPSSEFLEKTKEKGLVVKWCPQEKVLKHPAVACFITHCGWNSTLESMVAGVPLIAYPGWTDQPTSAKLIVDVFKNGVRMQLDEKFVAGAEEVKRCIREITDGPKAVEIKKKALELKVAAKKAIADDGSSDQNLNRFVSEIRGNLS